MLLWITNVNMGGGGSPATFKPFWARYCNVVMQPGRDS
jgi:hypothetical protein